MTERTHALRRAQFQIGVAALPQLPPDHGCEVAFAGRSNAGKSSAINALTGRRKLAFVSKTPGRTQQINYYALGDGRFLVDLPGYGYAQAPGAAKAEWDRLTETYLATRRSLKGIVLIMDVRHLFMQTDRAWLRELARSARPVLVLLTKADKLTHARAQEQLQLARATLAEYPLTGSVRLFSSFSGLNVQEVRVLVADWLGLPAPSNQRV